MNKKAVSRIGKSLAMFLLLSSSLPFSLAYAETVEEVPTSETTISTMADDPLKDKTESTTDNVPTIEDNKDEESQTSTSETKTPEKTTASSTEDSTKKKPKPKPFGGGIGPQTVNLIEGVDIDANFAQLLRTDKSTTNNGMAWSGFGKAQDQLTDDDMAALNIIKVDSKNLTSLDGIEYAVNIISLSCMRNQLTTLDLSTNMLLSSVNFTLNQLTSIILPVSPSLVTLECSNNQLTTLDLTGSTGLTTLNIGTNQFSTIDLTANTNLLSLTCTNNQLSSLDVTANTALQRVVCNRNQLNTLNLPAGTALNYLDCANNKLTTLDVTPYTELSYLACEYNRFIALDVTANTKLATLSCNANQLSSLNLTFNVNLTALTSTGNPIGALDLTTNTKLARLICAANQLSTLNLSTNTKLTDVYCNDNSLSTLDISANLLIRTLECSNNYLTGLDTTNNTKLTTLSINENKISNLNNLPILNSLETLNANSNMISDITPLLGYSKLSFSLRNQELTTPVPTVNSGQATVDILKTTAQAGLSVINNNISTSPTFSYNGDKIIMDNVTPDSLSDKYVDFSYNGSQLIEGATSGSKEFDGKITFFSASGLDNKLFPSDRKKCSGEGLWWNWHITSMGDKKAEDVHTTLNLPAGLVIDPASITKNGSSATLSDIDGTNNLGDLNTGEVITFRFQTTVSGNVEEWLEAKGRLDWKDGTINSPYNNESKGMVQIMDDQQTYTPKDGDDIALHSVPIYFNHGTYDIMTTAQTYHLHPMNYQSNTNVVTDGFYTRVKDDRTTSTGWQLRMPFDKVSLNVPANAGKKATRYKARLTWSLDDTL